MMYSRARGTALSALCLTFASTSLAFGQTPTITEVPTARALKVAQGAQPRPAGGWRPRLAGGTALTFDAIDW